MPEYSPAIHQRKEYKIMAATGNSLYIRFGARFAELIRNRTFVKKIIRNWMDKKVEWKLKREAGFACWVR
jgi:hypothetical protein